MLMRYRQTMHRLPVTLCIVAKQSVLELVTVDSLLEVVCEKSIGTKTNDIDPCLEIV